MFLSWSSWKSNKDIFLNISSSQNSRCFIHYDLWYLYEKKTRLFFLNSLEFQVNQENVHPTLTILKVVLALNTVYNKRR